MGSGRRPIRKGKLSQPNQFGYVDQLCEITANTKPGARGFILPPSSQIGNPAGNTLLPATAEPSWRTSDQAAEVIVDGGWTTGPTDTALEGLADTVHITAAKRPAPVAPAAADSATAPARKDGSATSTRLGLRRSRLKGDKGHRISDEWATLTSTPTPSPPSR